MRSARREGINGKQARRLRAIARTLKLPPPSTYDKQHTGAVALKACFRRAYLEAKALYKGAFVEEGRVDLSTEQAGVRPFRHLMVDSIKRQGEGPVER